MQQKFCSILKPRLMIEFYRASLAENVEKREARQSEITRQVQARFCTKRGLTIIAAVVVVLLLLFLLLSSLLLRVLLRLLLLVPFCFWILLFPALVWSLTGHLI